MEYLNTITKIHKYYKTNGKRPVLVTCNDFKDYVCKHKYRASTFSLFIEYLSSSFLKIWGIPTPEFAFIRVLNEHFHDCYNNELEPYYFDNLCFGSLYLPYAKDVDAFVSNNINLVKSSIHLRSDFLKIAMFDIWMANEDRSLNNANLLISFENKMGVIYAIDNENCFNSNSGYPLVQLTLDDSILGHDLFKLLFTKKKRTIILLNSICEDFIINVSQCKLLAFDIIQDSPDDWAIKKDEVMGFLNNNIFNDEWIDKSLSNFRLIFDYYYKRNR